MLLINWKNLAAALCLLTGLLFIFPHPALAFDTSADNELLLLVNGIHRIDRAYQPEDLVDTARKAPSKKSHMLLREPAATAYTDMIAAYKAESSRPLYSLSAFRTYAYQSRLFSSKVASRQRAGQSYMTAYRNTLQYTVLPGTSEHQTGLAIDLTTNGALSDSFRDTTQGKWLLEHCWDFGFILRYDEAKTDLTAIAYEPWHYRYVGLPHSLIIRDNGWVLEEYIAALHEQGMLEYADPEDTASVWRIYWTDDTAQEFDDVESISSDNTGGYIITTKTPLINSLLNEWSVAALTANNLLVMPA